MNYIKELNAFHDQTDVDKLSSSAVALWITMMQLNNKTGWKKEFAVPCSVILGKAGLAETSFKRARAELKKKGYIKHRSAGRNHAPYYEMISRVIEPWVNVGEAPGKDDPRDVQEGAGEASLFKRKEIKRKEKEGVGVYASAYEFYQENIGFLSPYIAERITLWCDEMSEELVIEAMKRAINNNKRFFQYCEGILQKWQSLGVRSLADVKAIEMESRSKAKKGFSAGSQTSCEVDIFEELRRGIEA
ncbi:DnaD domain-containing protein [Halobacillus campisalis]|uniref:DnaD domain-containing protein n=1 Tax=Halobacillus campisalis TaxID=435909 RepID=A0ABW2JZB7_9BACI|nr:DnaD domain protein [Halobacillus campisalis]